MPETLNQRYISVILTPCVHQQNVFDSKIQEVE